MTHDVIGPVPEGSEPDAYDRLRRRVLWSMPTGLYVVGSRGELDGVERYNLMTASLVVQVCVDPKLVAVSIEREALTTALVSSSERFSIAIIKRVDRAIVRRFVKPATNVVIDLGAQSGTIESEAVVLAPSGLPVLAKALAWLDCRVTEQIELGSHVLFVGEVTDVSGPEALGDGQPGDEVLRMEDTRMNYGG